MFSFSCYAADSISLEIAGAKQGQLKGDRHDGHITIEGAQAGLTRSTYREGGGGGVRPGPLSAADLVLMKQYDRASIGLIGLIATAERITDFKLRFWNAGADGKSQNYFSIILTGAIETADALTSTGAIPLETLHFKFDSIEYRDELQGKSVVINIVTPAPDALRLLEYPFSSEEEVRALIRAMP
jgi:type VI secretion system Hcp family effector